MWIFFLAYISTHTCMLRHVQTYVYVPTHILVHVYIIHGGDTVMHARTCADSHTKTYTYAYVNPQFDNI